jgi:hypothetical protein
VTWLPYWVPALCRRVLANQEAGSKRLTLQNKLLFTIPHSLLEIEGVRWGVKITLVLISY